MRPYRVRLAADVARDIDLIEEHLFQTYRYFGDDREEAGKRAAARVIGALSYVRGFETHPHRGTGHPELQPGIRTITNDGFVFYFEIDEPMSEVRILAVFFGSADHQRHMWQRLNG